MKITKETKEILQALKSNGYRAYLVGGSVRDYFLAKKSLDVDIATEARPDQVKEVFKGYTIIETGIRFGTLVLVIGRQNFEITSFRKDSDYSDNRRPDYVAFTDSLAEDLSRRDFTINAIAFNEEEGFIDPFNGREDIERGLIRGVGDPNLRFQEDALRILRALRFASVLNFDIEEKTKEAIFKNKELLRNISVERINIELKKMICGEGISDILIEYIGVLEIIIPELKDINLKETAYALANIDARVSLRYALILHKIPAKKILRNLKMDNKTRHEIVRLTENYDLSINADRIQVKECLSEYGVSFFFDLIKLKRALGLEEDSHLDLIEDIGRQIIEEKACLSLKELEINGRDLIELGIGAGREIALILDKLLDAEIKEEIENKRDDLLALARGMINSPGN